MTVAAPPTPIVVTHFTHISHLSTILQLGLLSDTAARQAGLVQTEIGNQEIKEMRRGRGASASPRRGGRLRSLLLRPTQPVVA